MAKPMIRPTHVGLSSSLFAKVFGGTCGLDHLARETGFQRRQAKKLTAAAFLSGILHTVLSHGRSARDIAIRAGLAAATSISRQNLWKRINHKAADFLSCCLARVLSGVLETTAGALACLPAGVGRVLVADSTILPLHPSLADVFPGASNQSGAIQASARVQAVLDLVKGAFVEFRLGSFRDNDQKAASWIPDLLRAGDLVLRDLGYFTLDSLRAIAAKGAFFITRLRSDAALCHPDGRPFDLLTELRAAPGGIHEMPVLAGATAQLAVRLVAVRLAPEAAAERRRKAKLDRDKRLKCSKWRMELLGWSITLDNLPTEIPARRVYPIYSLRWRVEIMFKSWKTNLGMRRPMPNSTGAAQAQAAIRACLIAAALAASAHAWLEVGRVAANPTSERSQSLSLLKTMPLICELLLLVVLPAANDPAALLRQLDYHCRYEKRRKLSNFSQVIRSVLFDSLG